MIGKVVPEAGVQVTVGLAGSTSVDVAVNVTTLPPGDVASWLILEGSASTGQTPSATDIMILSSAAALPGVTPVPTKDIKRISTILPTVAAVALEILELTIVPYAQVFLTVFEARSVFIVVSQSCTVIMSWLAA